MIELELRNQAEMQAGSRSRIYALLAQGFRFPDRALYESVVSGKFRASVAEAAAGLPYTLPVGGEWGSGMALSFQEFETRYMQHFDVGSQDGAPCSLYEGESEGGRLKVMEDLIRCYEHFGLRTASTARERPDHVATELEYMHYLTFKEADSQARGKNSQPYRQGQSDCLKVHLVDFARRVAERIAPLKIPFYSDLAICAKAFCEAEFSYLSKP